jgi:hypothetical protein
MHTSAHTQAKCAERIGESHCKEAHDLDESRKN